MYLSLMRGYVIVITKHVLYVMQFIITHGQEGLIGRKAKEAHGAARAFRWLQLNANVSQLWEQAA